MAPIILNTSMIAEKYALAAPPKNAAQPSDASDNLNLSQAALREVALTGRVAANAESGNLTSDQSQQLYTQISSIHSQIVADQKADGGTLSPADAKAVQQAQNQLSQTVYGDAHDGAAPPSGATVTQAGTREDLEAGRIVLNEKAGHLSSGQATQLGAELSGIQQQIAGDEQANGGTLSPTDAQAINQLQSQLSQQIYNTAHSVATPDKTSG
ncbi:MAG: hypothetical protein ABSC93_11410 [Bryobacteraceae bacterium]